MPKPKVTLKCPANTYTRPDERIVEFSSRAAGRLAGGLIRFADLPSQRLLVNVYRCDKEVLVIDPRQSRQILANALRALRTIRRMGSAPGVDPAAYAGKALEHLQADLKRSRQE